MDPHRSSLVLALHKGLVRRKEQALHKVLEQHRSKVQVRQHHCMLSYVRASEPTSPLVWVRELRMGRTQVLVLGRKRQLQQHCMKPCVHANGSAILLAWGPGHKPVPVRRQVLVHKQALVLVHSKMRRMLRCNPSCD